MWDALEALGPKLLAAKGADADTTLSYDSFYALLGSVAELRYPDGVPTNIHKNFSFVADSSTPPKQPAPAPAPAPPLPPPPPPLLPTPTANTNTNNQPPTTTNHHQQIRWLSSSFC